MLLHDIERHSVESPDVIAIADGTQEISYGALLPKIRGRMSWLALHNCRCLAICGDNSADWILWDLAAAFSAIPVVPLPPFFSSEQTEHALKLSGVSHLAIADSLVTSDVSRHQSLPTGTAKITFTSGSTGSPKGVCLPLSGLENVAKSIAHMLGASYAGRHLCVLPLSILLENVAGVYTALMIGATVHVPPLATLGMANPFAPDFSCLLAGVDEKKITSIILVPELLRGLVSAIENTGIRPEMLNFVAVGGAKVPSVLLESAVRLGLPVFEGYGLSECGSVVSLNTPSAMRPDTVGRFLDHVQAIVTPEGDIMIENACFLGYLGDNAPRSGSFATGDIGKIDTDGFLSLSGRRKNLIITGYGRNISPEWIESLLLAQPGIRQAVAYGDAQADVHALIVPMTPAAINVSASVDAVNKKLPVYARIAKFDVIPPLTFDGGFLTSNGRLRRENILQYYQRERAT